MIKKYSTRKPRGAYALRSAALALRYEWNTAHESAALIKVARQKQSRELNNASLESFLVHCRNLREFFGSVGQENTVLAKDFLGRTPRVRLPCIRKNKLRIHRRLAHLSFSRSRMSRDWDDKRMIKEIDGAMRIFIGRLSIKHRPIARKVFGAH